MIDRRTVIASALAAMAAPLPARAEGQAGVSRITAYAFSFPALASGDIRLAEYTGRPLLVINTASLCGASCTRPTLYARCPTSWPASGRRGSLAFELGSAVDVDRRDQILAVRAFNIGVHLIGRDVDQLCVRPAGVGHVTGGLAVVESCPFWIAFAARDVGVGRGMNHDVGLLSAQQFLGDDGVTQIAARAVHRHHRSQGCETVGEKRAEEPVGSGDDDLHASREKPA